MRIISAPCFSIIFLVGITGCSGKQQQLETAPVSGIVTLDGKVVTQGSVIFTPPQGWPAKGELDAEGRFTLSTYKQGDGAIVGGHAVAVIAESGVDPSEHFERPPPAPVKWLIPERYGSRTTSGLTAEVKSGEPNEVTLELFTDPRRSASR